MKHRHSVAGVSISLAIVALLLSIPGCIPGDKPLPEVESVTAALGAATPGTGVVDTIIVSWSASSDSRVDGYVIYRAEQGIGATIAEKSEFVLQALTIAIQYVDDDVHTSDLYPTVRYFYQIAVIDPDGILGPMSPEVSVEYSLPA